MMNTLDGVSTPRPKGLTMGYLYYNINRKNDSTEKIDLWCVAGYHARRLPPMVWQLNIKSR